MNTSFTARHFNASERLQAYCLDAASKLEKFYDGIIDCDIVVSPHPDHDSPQQVELTVKVAKTTLNATENAATYEQAILKAIDNMKRQLIKYKEKRLVK